MSTKLANNDRLIRSALEIFGVSETDPRSSKTDSPPSDMISAQDVESVVLLMKLMRTLRHATCCRFWQCLASSHSVGYLATILFRE